MNRECSGRLPVAESVGKPVENFCDRSAVSHKLSAMDPAKWYCQQSFVVQKSKWLVMNSQFQQALGLVHHDDLARVARKLKGRL